MVNPRRDEVRQGVVPVRQPGPRRGEDRAHADLDRAAVERVGAARREQHGVEAEGGAGAEDRADVGVVDEVLEHEHRAGAGEHVVDRAAAAAGASEASAPRCTWKPVTCSIRASDRT